jgi:hypothetical protein
MQSIWLFASEARIVYFNEVVDQEIKRHHLVLLKQKEIDFAHSNLILRHFNYGTLALGYLAEIGVI